MKRIFLVPIHQVITLDEDLVGTKARDIQVKILISLKEDCKGHMTDVVPDELFLTLIAVRFRRRDAGQEKGAYATMERLLRSAGPTSMSSLIFPADKGSGRDSFVD